MLKQTHISAGLDIHKLFLVATILTRTHEKWTERFERTESGLFQLKDWLISHNVQVVACESTSDYWVKIYDLLSPSIPVIVGNARDMKALSHKKTDKIDSEFISLLALNEMIQPSRIFLPDLREFRSTVRLRHQLVRKRTAIKNEIHHILDSELFRLSSALSDIFGKAGTLIMNGIVSGLPISGILALLPSNVKNKEEIFREILQSTLPQGAILRLESCLNLIRTYNAEIQDLTDLALDYAVRIYPQKFRILKSVPGIGDIVAMTILAEVGEINDFPTDAKFASWLGIVPRVYQSADKLHTGSITKRGPKNARWALIQGAHAAVRARGNDLKLFYQEKKDRIGSGKAIVAVARKMAIIIWHLLTKMEFYLDKQYRSKTSTKVYVKIPRQTSIEEVLSILHKAAVILKEPDPD